MFALLTALSPSANAQETIQFSFEYQGVNYSGASVDVGLVDINFDPVKNAVDIKKFPLQIVFYNGALGSQGASSDLKLLFKDDGIVFPDKNLNLNGKKYDGLSLNGPAKKRVDIAVTAKGKARILINKLYVKTPEGDVPVKITHSAKFEFEITDSPPTVTAPEPIEPKPGPKPNNGGKPAPVKIEKPRDLAAFDSILPLKGEERVRALKIFIDVFPGSSKITEAKTLMPLELVKHEVKTDTIVYLIKYAACAPQLDTTVITGELAEVFPGSGTYFLKIPVRSGETFDIILTDGCKKKDFRITKATVSGIPLQCVLDTTETDFTLALTGGGGPFVVEFLKDGQRFPRGFETLGSSNKTYTFPKSMLLDKTGTSGVFTLQILEGNIISPVEGNFFVPPAKPIWPWVAGAAIFMLSLVLLAQMRKRSRNKAVASKVKKLEESRQAEGLWTNPATPQPSTSVTVMKIRNITQPDTDPKALSEAAFDTLLEKGDHRMLKMNRLWHDTVLTEIHLSTKSIQGISKFLNEQRNTVLNEQEGTIPEIGGFLLGKYNVYEKTKQYRVLLEEFVPVIPEEHNVYQLQFSTESLVRELGDMQDEYPELSLVGWFHTHPGHGLFLSRPDLTIHDGFFKEKYQFAMEIDPMTPTFDTGFFTRTTSGPVNNSETISPNTSWFHWTEIEKT